jgi:hypothetical protein
MTTRSETTSEAECTASATSAEELNVKPAANFTTSEDRVDGGSHRRGPHDRLEILGVGRGRVVAVDLVQGHATLSALPLELVVVAVPGSGRTGVAGIIGVARKCANRRGRIGGAGGMFAPLMRRGLKDGRARPRARWLSRTRRSVVAHDAQVGNLRVLFRNKRTETARTWQRIFRLFFVVTLTGNQSGGVLFAFGNIRELRELRELREYSSERAVTPSWVSNRKRGGALSKISSRKYL